MEKTNLTKEIRNLANGLVRYMNDITTEDECITISPSQVFVIVFLNENQDRDIFQKDIEHEFNIRRSSVTSVLNNLENNDLIKRVQVDEDARLKKLLLTKKAYSIIESMESNLDNMESKLIEGLSKQEVLNFMLVLEKMQGNLNKESHNG